jgi:CheY-like chemotaxis protein
VLLVDDEEGARAALSAVLELLGAHVTAVSSCREALAQIDVQAPDLLLSDIAMPLEDGYDLIRQVRGRADGTAALPAVAVTAYAGVEHRLHALHAGFDEHVAKPVDPDHLARVMAQVASSSRRMGT